MRRYTLVFFLIGIIFFAQAGECFFFKAKTDCNGNKKSLLTLIGNLFGKKDNCVKEQPKPEPKPQPKPQPKPEVPSGYHPLPNYEKDKGYIELCKYLTKTLPIFSSVKVIKVERQTYKGFDYRIYVQFQYTTTVTLEQVIEVHCST